MKKASQRPPREQHDLLPDNREIRHPLWSEFTTATNKNNKQTEHAGELDGDDSSTPSSSSSSSSSSDSNPNHHSDHINMGSILRVPLSSRARRRDPYYDKPRKKSSHTHNNAFPAQVFENVRIIPFLFLSPSRVCR
jgi:hypothetical protein